MPHTFYAGKREIQSPVALCLNLLDIAFDGFNVGNILIGSMGNVDVGIQGLVILRVLFVDFFQIFIGPKR